MATAHAPDESRDGADTEEQHQHQHQQYHQHLQQHLPQPAIVLDSATPLSADRQFFFPQTQSQPAGLAGPFGFKPVAYSVSAASSPGLKSPAGQRTRRGHKYKHSSVSHHIFLEPTRRPPLQIPASLPTPTARECWRSVSREQAARALWCACHLLLAGGVQAAASGRDSLALTALSHLLLFDALGAILCVAVDVLGNFDVWKRASIRYPFGLQRAEVLASFAMAVFLSFMGLDLISHTLAHSLQSSGNHEPHRVHPHPPADPLASPYGRRGDDARHIGVSAGLGLVNFAALAAIGCTLVSALLLRNHARIGRALRLDYLAALPSALLRNPAHLLTLSCSAALLVLPLVGLDRLVWLDRGLAVACALAMVALGGSLALALGRMLLLSYSPPAAATPIPITATTTTTTTTTTTPADASAGPLDAVLAAIEADPLVRRVASAQFWQVHYGLCLANLRLHVSLGQYAGAEPAKLRDRIASIIRNRLAAPYGAGLARRWDVSTELIIDKDGAGGAGTGTAISHQPWAEARPATYGTAFALQ